ncbi:MAG: CHAT domain-containing protein [Desulfobacteraceae bacterium]|nr:CHAT domain-containing protein [Desulfobacteraceae bacterium]
MVQQDIMQRILSYLNQQAPDDKTGLTELCDAVKEHSKKDILQTLDYLKDKKLIELTGINRDHILCWITYTGRQIVKEFSKNTSEQEQEKVFIAPTKIKILFLASNPTNTARLQLDEELKAINTNLKLAKERDNLEMKQEWAITTDTLMQAILDETPTIVHFSGHGEQEGIFLHNEIGKKKLVTTEALSNLFKLFKDTVKCVVLNSCYSGQQAQAIKLHIPYVIGMKAGIPDKAASSFSIGFYKAIGAGREIPFAFELGKTAIQLEGVSGDDIPVLLIKPITLEA